MRAWSPGLTNQGQGSGVEAVVADWAESLAGSVENSSHRTNVGDERLATAPIRNAQNTPPQEVV
jgi:hypothetical protein